MMEYYVPLTLNNVIEGLNDLISTSDDLTGHELIVGIAYVADNEHEVPPGSIALFLRQNTLNPEEGNYGTVVLTPEKATRLM